MVEFVEYKSYLLKKYPSIFIVALDNFNKDILRKPSTNEKGYIRNLDSNIFKIETPERFYAFELTSKYQRFIGRLIDSNKDEFLISLITMEENKVKDNIYYDFSFKGFN